MDRVDLGDPCRVGAGIFDVALAASLSMDPQMEAVLDSRLARDWLVGSLQWAAYLALTAVARGSRADRTLDLLSGFNLK